MCGRDSCPSIALQMTLKPVLHYMRLFTNENSGTVFQIYCRPTESKLGISSLFGLLPSSE